MAEKFKLELLTPTRVLIQDEVEEVVVPGAEGELGIFAGHDPMMTALDMGIFRVVRGGKADTYFVSGGYVQITQEKVLILAEVSEHTRDIDVNRAKSAKERAEARLKSPIAENIDTLRAEMALRRALYRLEAAQR